MIGRWIRGNGQWRLVVTGFNREQTDILWWYQRSCYRTLVDIVTDYWQSVQILTSHVYARVFPLFSVAFIVAEILKWLGALVCHWSCIATRSLQISPSIRIILPPPPSLPTFFKSRIISVAFFHMRAHCLLDNRCVLYLFHFYLLASEFLFSSLYRTVLNAKKISIFRGNERIDSEKPSVMRTNLLLFILLHIYLSFYFLLSLFSFSSS